MAKKRKLAPLAPSLAVPHGVGKSSICCNASLRCCQKSEALEVVQEKTKKLDLNSTAPTKKKTGCTRPNLKPVDSLSLVGILSVAGVDYDRKRFRRSDLINEAEYLVGRDPLLLDQLQELGILPQTAGFPSSSDEKQSESMDRATRRRSGCFPPRLSKLLSTEASVALASLISREQARQTETNAASHSNPTQKRENSSSPASKITNKDNAKSKCGATPRASPSHDLFCTELPRLKETPKRSAYRMRLRERPSRAL